MSSADIREAAFFLFEGFFLGARFAALRLFVFFGADVAAIAFLATAFVDTDAFDAASTGIAWVDLAAVTSVFFDPFFFVFAGFFAADIAVTGLMRRLHS